MSIEAMSWVLKQDMSRSSEKFILVCLANYADERGVCYPSTPTLVRDTGQDRKTVTLNLQRLCEAGLLRDTNQRIGRTSSVPVYQIVGIPSASGVHYTFKVTNVETSEFYIGVRSFNGDPELDPYRGSSRWVVDMQGRGIPLHREVLEVFDNPVEAKAAELRTFRELSGDPLCRNEQAPHGANRAMKNLHWEKGAGNDANSSTPVFGAAPSTPVFPTSTPVFPGSTPVFPPKQARKRGAEPSVEPSEETLDKPPTKKAAKNAKSAPAAPVVMLPDWMPASTWAHWVEHRKACKAPLTERAAELCLIKLVKLRAAGHDPVAVIDQSVMSGKWTDLYAIKPEQDQQQRGGNARPAKFDPSDYVASGAAHATAPTSPRTSEQHQPFTIDAQFVERPS
jgi:hypothetical protein